MVPDALQGLPDMLKNTLSSSVTMAGFTAIVMSVLLPDTNSLKTN
jgi:xanthine permease XanP